VIDSLEFYSRRAYIGEYSYILRLSWTVRLHPVLHVNNLRLCFASSLRHVVPVTVLEGEDEEFDVSHISNVCITSLLGGRGQHLLFMTHFNDDDIPAVWHRLNGVHHTVAILDFLETSQWHVVAKIQAYVEFMSAHSTRIHESR
jgi:hypothetical protein